MKRLSSSIGRTEPATAVLPEERPGDEDSECHMDGKLADWVSKADGNVEEDPCESEPTRPVMPQEKKDSAEYGGEFGEFDADRVRVARQQLGEMTDEPGDSDEEIEAGDKNDRDRTLHHSSMPHRQFVYAKIPERVHRGWCYYHGPWKPRVFPI